MADEDFSFPEPFEPDEPTGLDLDVRMSSDTQTVPPPTADTPISNIPFRPGTLINQVFGPGAATRSFAPPNAAARPGAYAPGDDSSNSSVRSRLNAVYIGGSDVITPQANILSQYSSYTYNISLYLLSANDYRRLSTSTKVELSGAQLLISSGGAPITSANPASVNSDTPLGAGFSIDAFLQQQQISSAGRNQYFPLDYYIEDVRIVGLQPGKGTNGPVGITSLNFKIIEPNGITFLDNLYSAVQAYVGKKQNYAAQNYLMVIRFYGYDQNGNLVRATGLRDPNTITDSTAISEKYIPFQFTGIKFRVGNKLTEYDCEAVVTANNIAGGQQRGVIPYNVQLESSTLKELFTGNAVFRTTFNPTPDGRENTSSPNPTSANITPAAPPKASAAPQPNLVSGLVEALNEYEREHVANGIFNIADQYEIIFTDSILENARTTPPGNVDKSLTPLNQNQTASQQLNGAAQSMNTKARSTSILAGTSILQFIDQAIRNSTYIYEQQTKIFDPVTNDLKPQGNPSKIFAWYRIGLEAAPIGYDEKRNDYAYKITYQISPYLVNDVKSEYFPHGIYRGIQKRYNYWFSGQNTEVINYEQDFNFLYYIVVNSNQVNPRIRTDYRDVEKRGFQTRSNQSDQGVGGKVNEPGANAADILYSPADLSRARVTIIGDPAWIPQGELYRGVAGVNFNYGPFLQDGTINVESQEPLFEIGWNKPSDYNLQTGIQEPGQKQQSNNPLSDAINQTTQVAVYRAISVTSVFSAGKFTQDLEGLLVTFPESIIKYNENGVLDLGINDVVNETGRLLDNALGNIFNGQRLGSNGTRLPNRNILSDQPTTVGGAVLNSPAAPEQDLTLGPGESSNTTSNDEVVGTDDFRQEDLDSPLFTVESQVIDREP